MIRVFCPAKINTFLAVGAPDARGWHPVRTVLQAISLADELLIEAADAVEVLCDDPSVPADNSVLRAVRLLQEVADYPAVRVRLIKRIPSQAGFGGGSSDGAGVVRSASRLMRAPLPAHEFRAIVRALGTDAAFFPVGGRVLGEGYGERLTALEDAPARWLVLAQPEVRCSTPAMYAALDAEPRPFADFPGDLWTLANDFERVMPDACADLLRDLRGRGLAAGLTGSGSAVFALCESEARAERIAGEIRAPWVTVARTLAREESLRIEAA